MKRGGKPKADWYSNRKGRRVTPEMAVEQLQRLYEEQQADITREMKEEHFRSLQERARVSAAAQARWRADRIKAAQLDPVSLEGTFISRLQGDTLVLGFAEQLLEGRAYGVNLISKLPVARVVGDHPISSFVGRKCRVTVEVLP